MKNRKAWLRIVEAFIAVILIASVLTLLYVRTIGKTRSGEEVYNFERTILNEIAADANLREAVLKNSSINIINFVASRVPQNFNFTIRICEVNDICNLNLDSYKEEVYASERIISSTLTEYNPKKVKIFIWRES